MSIRQKQQGQILLPLRGILVFCDEAGGRPDKGGLDCKAFTRGGLGPASDEPIRKVSAADRRRGNVHR